MRSEIKNYDFLEGKLFVYSQLIVYFLPYLQKWTHLYNASRLLRSNVKNYDIFGISAVCLLSADCLLFDIAKYLIG